MVVHFIIFARPRLSNFSCHRHRRGPSSVPPPSVSGGGPPSFLPRRGELNWCRSHCHSDSSLTRHRVPQGLLSAAAVAAADESPLASPCSATRSGLRLPHNLAASLLLSSLLPYLATGGPSEMLPMPTSLLPRRRWASVPQLPQLLATVPYAPSTWRRRPLGCSRCRRTRRDCFDAMRDRQRWRLRRRRPWRRQPRPGSPLSRSPLTGRSPRICRTKRRRMTRNGRPRILWRGTAAP